MPQAVRLISLALLAGCGHSEPFVNVVPPVDPPPASADMRLTFNSDQDYWPVWTQDGRGILYSFADSASAAHRCIGLLPAGGGRRLWQLCDNRATQGDSLSSFPGYAIDNTGRLLYAAATATRIQPTLLTVTLWLADTAAPFARTPLLTLPVSGASGINWLTDIRWTGATTFVALGQLFEEFGNCAASSGASGGFRIGTPDTLFFQSGAVLTGTISGGHATLQAVSGTNGATGYSLAEGGASIVFTLAHDLRLFKVPATGGSAVTVTTIAQTGDAEILGVSCQGTTCVVSSAPASLTDPCNPGPPQLNNGTSRLDAVTLPDGTTRTLISNSGFVPAVYSAPQLSPVGGDVVSGVGGAWWGHLQTFIGGGNADLHLYPGLVQ